MINSLSLSLSLCILLFCGLSLLLPPSPSACFSVTVKRSAQLVLPKLASGKVLIYHALYVARLYDVVCVSPRRLHLIEASQVLSALHVDGVYFRLLAFHVLHEFCYSVAPVNTCCSTVHGIFWGRGHNTLAKGPNKIRGTTKFWERTCGSGGGGGSCWLLNVPATCECISGTDLLSFTCCHTETEVADPTFHLTQSQCTHTRLTDPSTDPIKPGAWQGSHWSANFEVIGMTRPRKNPAANGIRTRDLPLSRRTP